MNLKFTIITVMLAVLSFAYFTNNFNSENLNKKFRSFNKAGDENKLYPYEWSYIKNTFPYYKYDPNVYIDAIKEANELKRQTREMSLSKGLSQPQWEFAGPVNVGGRVVDLEFNPFDPNIIYAGFATGGVFKSTDMGQSWFPIFDDQAVLTVGDIAVDPQNPDVIYVGTGEGNGGHNNFPGGGVFKSTDTGNTWQFLGLTETVSIGRVVINPSNTNEVFIAAEGSYFGPNPERGVYKSTDGGTNWSLSLFVNDSTGAADIIVDPVNPNRMMAAMWERVRRPTTSHLYGPSSGIYKTTDGGDNWTLIQPSAGLPDPGSQNIGRIGLAVYPQNPDIVYALYTDGYDILSLFKSTDFGNSWTNADPGNGLGSAGFSWYFGQVRVSPVNSDQVFVLDVDVFRSTNSGTNWSTPTASHVDNHALAFNPNDPNFVILGNDGGINISTNGGVSWGAPAQIPATQFYEIGIDANNPLRLYGGTQDNGTNRTLDGGIDNWDHIYGGDGFYVIVDHTNPNIIYAESQNGGLGKSTDGGNNFFSATNGISFSEPTNWSTPVVMDPNNANILYYGTDYLYQTTNGAGLWNKISPKLTDYDGGRLGTITTIAVAPSNSNVIYVGTDDSHVWVSPDNGTTWNEISDGLPVRWVSRVGVDPSDENVVYATFNGLKWRDPQPHVFRSSDMGTTWTDISGNLPDAPVNAFAVDNNYPERLYVGNDVGMYYTFNTGQSWYVLGEGLPVLPVGDIEIHPTENYLVVGTYGRSMYKIDLNSVTRTINNEPELAADNFKLFQNYPNPFNPATNIQFTVNISQFITLKIYDILGNEITTLVNEEKPAGDYKINFNANNLSSGIYYYTLTAGNLKQTKKMILLK